MKIHVIPALVAFAILIFGCTGALYHRQELVDSQQARKEEQFKRSTAQLIRQLTERIQIYEYGLRGTRGAVLTAGSENISREKFLTYSHSRDLNREFPGARGFGFIRRVSPSDVSKYLQKARNDDWPDFKIRELSPNNGDRMVIQYIEPVATNRAAVGLDIASEKLRHEAAMTAISTGNPTLTAPLTLVQESGKTQKGLLFLLPIYRQGQTLETAEQRAQAYFGLAYAALLVDDVLADIDLAINGLSLSISDAGNAADPIRFYTSDSTDDANQDGLVERRHIPIYGRDWLVEIKARPMFFSRLGLQNPDREAAQFLFAVILLSVMAWLAMINIQRRRQAALDHAKLAAIVESSTDAIIGKDLEGVVTSWNRAAIDIFGYETHEAIGRKISELIIPPHLDYEENEILDQIKQGKEIPHRTAVRCKKDGTLIDVSVTVSPILSEKGDVIGASKTVSDVTEENRKERRFRLAIDAAGVGVWVWQLQTNELVWDELMFEIYGAPESLRDTKLYYDFWKGHVHPNDLALAEEKLQQLIAGAGAYDPIFRIVRDDGEVRWIQASATIESDHDGNALQMLGTNLDITDLVRARERIQELNADLEAQVAQRTAELQEALAVAQRATEAKSEFLSNMSHEIRTPMNAVLGMAYLLQKQDLPAESRAMVGKIHSSGRALLGIINDILDFSKIEANRLEIEYVPFRLSDVLENLATIMGSAVGGKPVETVIASPPSGADYLKGDSLRLGQVLTNLAGNAIKFTSEGEVVVSITRLESADLDRVKLRFSVRDTGIGIPLDKQATIFKAFSQADTSTTRSYGGTGLGLTISSRLVELMGGVLRVSSEPGHGSEFSFEIDFGLSAPILTSLPSMAHQRVLIADDQHSARTVLADAVSSLGWHADVVESGEKAIKCANCDVNQCYDVVLLDWRMPGIDGLKAAQHIRDISYQEKPPIIVMVTAFDREQLESQPGREVADVILTKPVTSSLLFNAVQMAKHQRGELEILALDETAQLRLAGLRVLVVDDSEINREVASRILEGEGAVVDLAEDGQQALGILVNRPGDFDVVLMDMQMPVMDGYAATKMIRATPILAHLPVIALSAGAFAEQRKQALDAGVNDFVAKPFEVEILINTVLLVTSAAITGTAPATSTPPPDSTVKPNGDSDSVESTVMNVERALRIWKEATTYARFLRKFAQSHEKTVSMIMMASSNEAVMLAHKLRGTAAQLGLEQVADLAMQVEEALRLGQVEPPMLLQLQVTMDAALAAIEQYAPTNEHAQNPVATSDTNDPKVLAPNFSSLMQALDTDDIKMVEPILSDLASLLPAAQLTPLRDAVSNYDFRGAEAILFKLADHLQIELRR